MPRQRHADLEHLLENACHAYAHVAAHRRLDDTTFWRARELEAVDHIQTVLDAIRPHLQTPPREPWPTEVFRR